MKHRFISLLLTYKKLSTEEYLIYEQLLEITDWRKESPHFGIFRGTREEVNEKLSPQGILSQRKFNESFSKLLELGLIKKEGARAWRIPNFQIHLAPKERPEEFREIKNSEKNFCEYCTKKLQNLHKKNAKSAISEMLEEVILYLTDEEKWKSHSNP